MGWILGIDVRDGQRMAFPEFSSAISYDLTSYRSRLAKDTSEVRNVMERIRGGIASGEIPDEESVHIALSKFEKRLDDVARAERLVEGVIIFDGSTWPLRAMRFVTEWEAVRDFVSSSSDEGPLLDMDPLQALIDSIELTKDDSDTDENG